MWIAAESGTQWSGALYWAITNTTNYTYAFNDTSRHTGDKNWIQQVFLWLSSSFPINYTCYQYTAVGKYCFLCVQMLDDANWHEAPWRPGLFTIYCEVDTVWGGGGGGGQINAI